VEQSDWELVRQCKSGDRQAFRELVERYQRKAVAIAFGILHDREDALEVAQEAFAKVFTGIQKFKEEASFYTWLYRITVNLAIDRQRQKNRQPLLEREDSGEGENARAARIEGIPDTAEADPYEQVKDKELGERIRAALAELTPAHKAVILLREVEGLSYEEISEVLQCSRGTVMSRLHYARKKLQSRLRRDL
jgi:RNA polymerase sigma-70 factor (ECF subfamily)